MDASENGKHLALTLLWVVVGLGLPLAGFALCDPCAGTTSFSGIDTVSAAGETATPVPPVHAHGEQSCACTELIVSLWAVGGGFLGALLNIGRLRMSTRLPENRVKRGVVFEPPIGAGVALIAYLVFLTRQVTIFPVPEVAGPPDEARALLLGLLAGLLWEPLLRRVHAIYEEDTKKQAASGGSGSPGNPPEA